MLNYKPTKRMTSKQLRCTIFRYRSQFI